MNKKILPIISVLLVIIIATVSIYQTYQYQKNAHQNREFSFIEILGEKAYSNEQQLAPYFETADSLITTIKQINQQNPSITFKAIAPYLSQLENTEHIKSIFLLDSIGNCLYNSKNGLLKKNHIFHKCPKDIMQEIKHFTWQKI